MNGYTFLIGALAWAVVFSLFDGPRRPPPPPAVTVVIFHPEGDGDA